MKLRFKIAIIGVVIICIAAMLLIGYNMNKDKYIEENEKEDAQLVTEYTEVEDALENTTEEIEFENEVEHETEPVIEMEPIEEVEPTKEGEVIEETEPTTEVIEETEPIEEKPVFYLSDYERQVVECLVMGESGAEPYDGQVLVAQCILNACLKDGLQPSQVRKQYGYYGWHNNPSESVKDAVSAVFDDGYKITEELILYFYAPKYSSGRWHETQCFVIELGGHRFFSEW